MTDLIGRALSHEAVRTNPPVFVDIGASGGLARTWRAFAPYSICIAFDADQRDFAVNESSGNAWLKSYSINRIVSPQSEAEATFYLTAAPHCSSTLEPDKDALSAYAFSERFNVESIASIEAVGLPQVLEDLSITHVDWFKADSQGTDLKLFLSLPESMQKRVIVAQFEPGIMDAYHGEDMAFEVMFAMRERRFWTAEMTVKGSQRVGKTFLSRLEPIQRRYLHRLHGTAPGWCELTYMRELSSFETSRSLLLAWAFATALGQHGDAFEAASMGLALDDAIFEDLQAHSIRAISGPMS